MDGGGTVADWGRPPPPELEPLTTKPLVVVVNGPDGIDLELEEELAQLDDEEAAAFREGAGSALEEVVLRLKDSLDLIAFFTVGDTEARAWTLRRGQTALDAAESIHTDIARGFIRCEVIDWQDLLELRLARRGRRSAAFSGSRARSTSSEDGDVHQHPLQPLAVASLAAAVSRRSRPPPPPDDAGGIERGLLCQRRPANPGLPGRDRGRAADNRQRASALHPRQPLAEHHAREDRDHRPGRATRARPRR